MARLATAADFEQPGGLYGSQVEDSPGSGVFVWSGYKRYPFFAQRAAVIQQQFPSVSVLVAGCGWGYLVDELRALNMNAWGVDASPYCITKATTLWPIGHRTNGRVLLGDCTIAAAMATVRTTALGGPITRRFGVVVTEDLLPVLTEVEITAALSALRTIATAMFHIVTTDDGNSVSLSTADWVKYHDSQRGAGPPVAATATRPITTVRHADLTWLTLAQWKARVGTDSVLDAETGTIV